MIWQISSFTRIQKGLIFYVSLITNLGLILSSISMQNSYPISIQISYSISIQIWFPISLIGKYKYGIQFNIQFGTPFNSQAISKLSIWIRQKTQINVYMYVSEYYSKDRVYSDLFIDNMIYMKQWGGLNRNSCLLMFNFHHIFLYIYLAQICSNGFQILLWAQ